MIDGDGSVRCGSVGRRVIVSLRSPVAESCKRYGLADHLGGQIARDHAFVDRCPRGWSGSGGVTMTTAVSPVRRTESVTLPEGQLRPRATATASTSDILVPDAVGPAWRDGARRSSRGGGPPISRKIVDDSSGRTAPGHPSGRCAGPQVHRVVSGAGGKAGVNGAPGGGNLPGAPPRRCRCGPEPCGRASWNGVRGGGLMAAV